ncbi:tyrosine/serine/threonine protein phosphatase pps1 [Haplosporangium sp. Z 767]|nr:tyrosine/serine/threonine protein phosphatase pps1 [Haplosporangium sp. Z 767]KAF9182139.1 tyrosine/serine/threonine protein phosphatase pps1 [Haplosporangium sp. Z 11]
MSMPLSMSMSSDPPTPAITSFSSTSVPALSYTLINTQPPVRAINGDQLFQLHQKFISTPLPSKSMFPWLHGVDGTSSPQNYFFGLEHYFHGAGGAAAGESGGITFKAAKLPLPEHRGLMFIHANDLDAGRLVGSVSPFEILQPFSVNAQNKGNNNSHDDYNQAQNQDINNHPQMLHQHSTVATSQGPIIDEHNTANVTAASSEWADISDDSANSSLSCSSLSSTTSSSFVNSSIATATNGATTMMATTTTLQRTMSTTTRAKALSSSFLHSLSEGINIRNFKIQVPRYALLSDIVLYAREGEQDPGLLQLAKQISLAQEEVWMAMKEQYPQIAVESRRQTLVLTDTFVAFEAKYPELVAVTSGGKPGINKVDFWEQEREQMSLLTRASEIAPGIWLGNNQDVPLTNNGASSLATPVSPGTSFSSYFFSRSSIPNTLSQHESLNKSFAIPTTPPPDEIEYPPLTPPSFNDHSNFQPSICIECRSGSNAPTTMTLDRIKNNVACTPAPLAVKEIFHLECQGSLTAGVNPEAFPPSTSSLSSFARADRVDVSSNHAMRRATAAGLARGHPLARTMLQPHITNLINMAFFIQSVATPERLAPVHSSSSTTINTSARQQHRHQILIHCMDGYTETALLALCVIMIHYRLSLAEAYLKLQTDLGRSFFVYPNDAIMMLEVENQVWHRILAEKAEREASARLKAASTSAVPVSLDLGASIVGRSIPTSPVSSAMSSVASSMSSSSSSFFSSLLNMSNQPPTSQQQKEQGQGQPLDMIEGMESMPDRDQELISHRPFLQPGHENKFEWFYHPEFEGSFPSRILPFLYLGNLAHASNPGLLKSLGIRYVLSVGEEAHGLDTAYDDTLRVDGAEGTGCGGKATDQSRFMVKLVDDMYDNGVDSLWRHIENCVEFVDEARKANSKILIHCRVGVSRSATIVIAYLMAHYNLSLVDAYLMVRARRLSVIIQPNLLFMYELLQWEQRLRGRFDPMGWPGVAKEVHGLNMYYIGN